MPLPCPFPQPPHLRKDGLALAHNVAVPRHDARAAGALQRRYDCVECVERHGRREVSGPPQRRAEDARRVQAHLCGDDLGPEAAAATAAAASTLAAC